MTPLLIMKCRERGGRRESPGGQRDPGSEAKTGTGEEGKVEDTWAALPHDAESDLKACWQLGQIFDLGKRRWCWREKPLSNQLKSQEVEHRITSRLHTQGFYNKRNKEREAHESEGCWEKSVTAITAACLDINVFWDLQEGSYKNDEIILL